MKKATILLLLMLITSVISAQNKIPQDVKDHIKTRVDQGFNMGIAVAHIDGDEVEYFNYGKTAKNGSDVTNTTVFEIGSISKTFTTILLAEQLLNGSMSLDDPVSKYLPKDKKVPSRNERQITLKDIATHSSALPRMPNNFNPADGNDPFADYGAEELFTFLSSYELTRDIGAQYEYSNLAMGLLGYILELHTGKTYQELITERIGNPLKMNDINVRVSQDMQKRLAIGHNEEGNAVANWNFDVLAGAGALKSTTEDMVKFIKANINGDDSDLANAMKLTHQATYSAPSQNLEIGLAWHYAVNNTIVWHNGGTGGYRAFAGFVKGTNKGVVVLTNSSESVDQIGLKLLNPSLQLTLPKKQVHKEEIEMSNEILDTYVGEYELAPNFIITVTRKDNNLFLQATGQPEFQVFASAKNEFFLKVVEASITFNVNDQGKVESLTLHQNGQNAPGKKIK
ncbi:serine hydrolase [Winogradskyella immobilis]|uniref:Beta-lactamase n=1 Tax=Winogradskyella immobilis TaxID=2816852 RepID=A0ABS8EMY3_9FLAO|nr:serine hydrolase [Winogradskyella immobilis]MCC1484583.1 serine hydrolase [Winogradskyella immobilis]MCG0016675.1 serine hydrolase [Winogradskyella immobilis]